MSSYDDRVGELYGEIDELKNSKAALLAALEAMLKAAPQSIDNTAGHELFGANNEAHTAIKQAKDDA